MGELQHGIYDDECKGLTEEEINAFYDFDNDGESQVLDKSADKTDSDSDDSDDSDSVIGPLLAQARLPPILAFISAIISNVAP